MWRATGYDLLIDAEVPESQEMIELSFLMPMPVTVSRKCKHLKKETTQEHKNTEGRYYRWLKRKLYFSSVFFVISALRFQVQRETATKYTPYWTLLFLTNETYCKWGTPATGMENRWASSQYSSIENTLLNHPEMTVFYNRSFSKYNIWNCGRTKIICTHNSLYHRLNFKNCNDTFCKSNRLLEVSYATQLLLLILWSIYFTYTRKYQQSVFLVSFGVYILLAHKVCPNDHGKFLNIKPLHTES